MPGFEFKFLASEYKFQDNLPKEGTPSGTDSRFWGNDGEVDNYVTDNYHFGATGSAGGSSCPGWGGTLNNQGGYSCGGAYGQGDALCSNQNGQMPTNPSRGLTWDFWGVDDQIDHMMNVLRNVFGAKKVKVDKITLTLRANGGWRNCLPYDGYGCFESPNRLPAYYNSHGKTINLKIDVGEFGNGYKLASTNLYDWFQTDNTKHNIWDNESITVPSDLTSLIDIDAFESNFRSKGFALSIDLVDFSCWVGGVKWCLYDYSCIVNLTYTTHIDNFYVSIKTDPKIKCSGVFTCSYGSLPFSFAENSSQTLNIASSFQIQEGTVVNFTLANLDMSNTWYTIDKVSTNSGSFTASEGGSYEITIYSRLRLDGSLLFKAIEGDSPLPPPEGSITYENNLYFPYDKVLIIILNKKYTNHDDSIKDQITLLDTLVDEYKIINKIEFFDNQLYFSIYLNDNLDSETTYLLHLPEHLLTDGESVNYTDFEFRPRTDFKKLVTPFNKDYIKAPKDTIKCNILYDLTCINKDKVYSNTDNIKWSYNDFLCDINNKSFIFNRNTPTNGIYLYYNAEYILNIFYFNILNENEFQVISYQQPLSHYFGKDLSNGDVKDLDPNLVYTINYKLIKTSDLTKIYTKIYEISPEDTYNLNNNINHVFLDSSQRLDYSAAFNNIKGIKQFNKENL